MAPFATGERQKIDPEKMREAFGGRSSTDYLDWLLRPRPVGTVAAVPLYGIDHGGEQTSTRAASTATSPGSGRPTGA